MPRMVWISTAIAWALSALLVVAGGSGTPSALLAWVAVLASAAGWLLLGPAVILATRLVSSRAARALGLAIAVGAVVAGLASLVGSVAGSSGVATWYVDGILLATILLVPLAYLFARDRANLLAIATLALFLGVGFIAGGLGGLLVAASFGALAARPDRFRPRPRPILPELPVEVEPA